jgi:hypothetical protein
MTDYSGWTDEQVNGAIFIAKGWKWFDYGLVWCNQNHREWGVELRVHDYTNDWRLCGGLLEEMKEADVNLQYYPTLNKWGCEWIQNSYEMGDVESDTPQRAICEAWLAWKEQG